MDDEEVLEEIFKPLDSNQIMKLVNGKANLLDYEDFTKFDNINSAMGEHNALILLYLTGKDYGHWTCVFRTSPNTVEFFDSYGYKPDSEFKFIPEHWKEYYNQIYPHMLELLSETEDNIIYNNHKLQSTEKTPIGIPATCGYWVATRLNFRDIPINEFAQIFNTLKHNKISPDYMVVALNKNKL